MFDGRLLLLCGLLIALPARAADSAAAAVTVFAAASLTNAVQDLGDGFSKSSGVPVKLSFAASSALARQIESGAPADVFFSADLDWMDYLAAHGLIRPDTRRDVIGNRLVLIAPASSLLKLTIAPHFGLAAALGKGRLATGDPDSVPVGRYARSALMSLDVWSQVADRLIRADNVRAALAYVASGEAPLGIVYETDALLEKNVRTVDVFPAETHAPITYPIALTRNGSPAAAKFVAYVLSPAGDAVFKQYGFTSLLGEPRLR